MSARILAVWLTMAAAAAAAPPLTTIQDVLYKADGSRFSGLLVISWKSFEASDRSNITTHSVTVKVVSGALRVQLVPTTTGTPSGSYLVKYNSDGKVQFEETWSVPPAAQALRVRDVRVAIGAGQVGNDTLTTPIQETDVTGLAADLTARPVKSAAYAPGRALFANAEGALEAVTGSAYDCVRVDGSSGPCGGGTDTASFVDGETPAGLVNGINVTYTLSGIPSPVSSLALYRNGLRVKANLDYTIAGNTIIFATAATPQSGDILLANYRVSADSGTQYTPPQVLCSGIGAATASTSDTSLGTCTIPSGLLLPGDRVEIRFVFQHAGAASGFHFDVNWGSSAVIQRDASLADALVSGRADVAIMADSALLSGQSWGTALPMAGSVGTADQSGLAGVTVEFLGRLSGSGGDTLALKSFTVIRFP
jgi:hypothetical protein